MYLSGKAEGYLWRGKNDTPDEKRPLFVLLHGGPHGAVGTDYTILRRILLESGINLNI